MVAPSKGILAIDESMSTCKKRFDSLKIECTEENRRTYRELLITAPEIENAISGMILFDETIKQKTGSGIPFPHVLKNKGIIPGIKVDMGLKDMPLHPGEKIAEGLDGLRERIAEYKTLGAQFTKWRIVITIGNGVPTRACIKANAHTLARYAAYAQEADLIPIIEPEILMDGDHTIEKCYDVTAETLKTVFAEVAEQNIHLPGLVLKVSMVLSGKNCPVQADVETVAKMTSKCLKENAPTELAGIVFLSGGQTDEKATAHLNAINKLGRHPWPVSFSYGRAIQNPALLIWAKNMADSPRAQKALVNRANLNGLATQGRYSADMEKQLA